MSLNRSPATMFLIGVLKSPVIVVVNLSVSTGTGEWARRTKTMEYLYLRAGGSVDSLAWAGGSVYDRTR